MSSDSIDCDDTNASGGRDNSSKLKRCFDEMNGSMRDDVDRHDQFCVEGAVDIQDQEFQIGLDEGDSSKRFRRVAVKGDSEKKGVGLSDMMVEQSITDNVLDQDSDACFSRVCKLQESNSCLAESASVSVTTDVGVNHIHWESEKLPEINKVLAEAQSKMEFDESAAGTTKRKELHGTTPIRALSGSWKDKADGATFFAYRFDFSCNIATEIFSSFVLLTESKLADDVIDVNIDLFLLSKKVVKSSVVSCGQLNLNADQVTRAMHFHELLFNGLFGKLFDISKSGGTLTLREFRLQKHKEFLWKSPYLYLILPLEPSSIDTPDGWRIDWKGISSCGPVIQFFEDSISVYTKPTQANCSSSGSGCPISINEPRDKVYREDDVIIMANTSCYMKDLKNKVVMAAHTGKMYTVYEVISNSSAQSPFDADLTGTLYISFADYYKKKYGIVLSHPGQPMLLLKQSHNSHNLLLDFNSEMVAGSTLNHVRIPPELLVSLDVPNSVVKAAYLIPSLMYRLESRLLANQLAEEIAYNSSESHISCSLILEGLTTLKCSETFSFERLELLGDSVLKYVVSHHLFLKFPEISEGELSKRRSMVISNASLHNVGIMRKLQGYIRDGPFEPRRWCAPGQLCIHPFSCSHGVETSEVPLDSRFQTCEEKVMKGKVCDRGHRWMCSKTIADCVEALIGAYYVGGGLKAALHFLKWVGIEVDVKQSYIDFAIKRASVLPWYPVTDEIQALEAKLGFEFSTKGLLLEAITHENRRSETGYSYQRLEFLGDSALDLLITRYLYLAYEEIDPGELTDLRSASVSNDNFAQVAVRYNFYRHLQCLTAILLSQVREYATFVTDDQKTVRELQSKKAPKVLGDLVESIAGAVLLDTKLNFDKLWRVFEPLLSPIVTPDKLHLSPFRELSELCASLGYFMKEGCKMVKDSVHVELRVQLKDFLLVGKGKDRIRKYARGQAAVNLLKDLQTRGITYAECVSRRSKGDIISNGTPDRDLAEHASTQEQKMPEVSPVSSSLQNSQHVSAETPVIGPINTRKGGPRTALHELCKKLQWPLPDYDTTEEKSRTPVEVGEGTDKRTSFNIFVSTIKLHIPVSGPVVEVKGGQRADKKGSMDSAALSLLFELRQLGKIVINDAGSS